jgi:UDP-2-acetamido-2-deoxy-ribo-hexuluronate aminotransferase
MTGLVAQHESLEAELVPRVLEIARAQSFVLGEPVRAFERTLCRMLGVAGAVGVASGTDALVLALKAIGIGEGDVVVVPAFGFVASVEAVVLAGARPLFADVRDFVLDRASVDAALSEAPEETRSRVRAILPVHLFGECAPMTALSDLARAHGFLIVEDAAQAILATDARRAAGSMGSIGALSFFPTKNLGGWGDGGAVVLNDAALTDRVRRLRQHGMKDGRSLEVGTNSRLDALQAAVLEVKAKHLEAWTVRRGQVAAVYRRDLAALEGRLRLPPEPREGCRHVYHQFVVRVEAPESLARHLEGRGIETRRYYPHALHQEPAYARFAQSRRFPNAEAAARTSLGLPIYPELTEDAQHSVIDAIREFFA